MVLYRKYRPQKLSELDSEEVRVRLTRIMASSYVPHALLFAGPKGTGKTSAARIVAKIVNCEKLAKRKKSQENLEPCNICEACRAITEGRHLDVLEIDAASNRGIDEIRELREKIKLAPLSAKMKVYIIDEVHMLTNEAFNALLKTLEEPPAHAMFILATTESDKLPATITSRCIRINFQKANVPEVTSSLQRVAKGEKISIFPEVLTLIAENSDGSFRDATKLLEQAILEGSLTPEKVRNLLGRAGLSSDKLLELVIKQNADEGLVQIVQMAKTGVNARFLVEDILTTLHAALLKHYSIESKEIASAEITGMNKREILALIKLFSRVFVEQKNATNAYLPLEVAVVEWCEKEVKSTK